MKKLMYLFIAATTMIVSSCSDDDSNDQPPGGYFGPNCARLFGFIAPVISVQTAPLP